MKRWVLGGLGILALLILGIGVSVFVFPLGWGPSPVNGQMMGPGRGMRGGPMGGMFALMAWMRGGDIVPVLTQPAPPETLRTVALGQNIYHHRCVVCHGDNGDGNGREARRLETPPRNFQDGVYKFRSTPTGSLPLERDLVVTLTRGIRGTAMLPWPALSEQQRWAVAYFLKTLSPRFQEEKPEPPVPISPPPSNLHSLRNKGRQVYEEAKCWECHGKEGRGDGPKAEELKDDWERPISPRDFQLGHFKAGSRPQDLYRTIATGLDGTPMASFSDTLSTEEIWALVAYVRSIAPSRPVRVRGGMGMMGGMGMTRDEWLGMRIDHPGMSRGGRGMMR